MMTHCVASVAGAVGGQSLLWNFRYLLFRLKTISAVELSLHTELTGFVAQWLENRNSCPTTLGSIALRGRVNNMFLYPSCAALIVPDPFLVYGTHPVMCAR